MDKPNKFRLNHKYLSSTLKVGGKEIENKVIELFYINSTYKYYNSLLKHYCKLFCFTKNDFSDLNDIEENFKIGRTFLIFSLSDIHTDFGILYNERLGFLFEINFPHLSLMTYNNISKIIKEFLINKIPNLKIYKHPHDGDMFFNDEESPNEVIEYPYNGFFSKTFLHSLCSSRVKGEYENIIEIEQENFKPLGYGLTFYN